MAVCMVAECGKKTKAKGVCGTHYMRLRRTGHLGSSRNYSFDREEAFSARVERNVESGCLVWTGAKTRQGYGAMTRGGGRMVGAHRYAWERVNGPIPEWASIDHTCYRRDCVEVDHLRLVSTSQNGWNRSGANRNSTLGARNVYRDKKRYRVRVYKNGAKHDLGPFVSVEEAAEAAETLRRELFGEYAGKGT